MPLLTAASTESSDRSLRDTLKDGMIRGVVLTIPLLLTLLILGFVVNFVFSRLDPFVKVLEKNFGVNVHPLVLQLGLLFLLLLLILLIGLISRSWSRSDAVEGAFDDLVSSIPGIGQVYSSFNEMSELLLDSENQSFEDVMLVEYPTQGSYAMAFVTADTPERIEQQAGHDEMITLFMPMAPNPVMGGYVITVDKERVIDVDMSVQEGIQAIVTSGVSLGSRSETPVAGDNLTELQSQATEQNETS